MSLPVYVLDACALIAYLGDESGADIVESRLKQASGRQSSVIINKLTLLEVYYGFYREHGKEFADSVYRDVLQSDVEIAEGFSDAVFLEAGRLKATYKMSLADSIVLGEAAIRGGFILTSDHHEFDAVEKAEPIKFEWIR